MTTTSVGWRAGHFAGLAAMAVLCLAAGQDPQLLPGFADRVDVTRVVVDVHVLESGGWPVAGLQSDDFDVQVDDRRVRIEYVRWTTESVASRGGERAAAPSGTWGGDADRPGLPKGRLIVLLVQKDLEASRIEGLLRMLSEARAFVSGLDADDQVAIAVFTSHLELRTDFTRDRAGTAEALERLVLFPGGAGVQPASGTPSLARGFDRDAGREAASMEQALLVLARALDEVPGSKSLVLLGHGFGRTSAITLGPLAAWSVGVEREYGEAARLFARGRVTVFCLDVTRAASHTLESALRRVASDTGGFYLSTDEFPTGAMARVARALAGHYELSFEKPDLPRGEHRIRIRLRGRQGTVFARPTYIG